MDPYQDDFNVEDQPAPLTVFGISLKYLLVAALVITSLLIVFDWPRIFDLVEQSLDRLKPPNVNQTTVSPKDRTIAPTTEELAEVMHEVREKKLQIIEQTQPAIVDAEVYYLIVLTNGKTLDANHLVIQDEQIVITSPSGIVTTLSKADVSSISRHALPPPPTDSQ